MQYVHMCHNLCGNSHLDSIRVFQQVQVTYFCTIAGITANFQNLFIAETELIDNLKHMNWSENGSKV